MSAEDPLRRDAAVLAALQGDYAQADLVSVEANEMPWSKAIEALEPNGLLPSNITTSDGHTPYKPSPDMPHWLVKVVSVDGSQCRLDYYLIRNEIKIGIGTLLPFGTPCPERKIDERTTALLAAAKHNPTYGYYRIAGMRLTESRSVESAQDEIADEGFSLNLDSGVDEGRGDVWLVIFSAMTPGNILLYPSGVPDSRDIPSAGACLAFVVVVDPESPEDSLADWRRSDSCEDSKTSS